MLLMPAAHAPQVGVRIVPFEEELNESPALHASTRVSKVRITSQCTLLNKSLVSGIEVVQIDTVAQELPLGKSQKQPQAS